ncbi:DUF6894 family protein [Rhizobium rhizophilum]|uniref:DUF6894 domain-containing protein n=1 Tax=Rhizobium rhizophilum TaxID=1850373 RepID=A0ABY2QYU1_9HYPH|nr:hypothetical protein [Rhizobium rhizophilum]THV16781.1 hypothetical protein E9677_01905 [Rhizobium rhizophilum]
MTSVRRRHRPAFVRGAHQSARRRGWNLPKGMPLKRMKRYFFHIRERTELELDIEGVEFPDDAAARCGAISAAKEMVVEAVIGDATIDGRQLEVMSAGGDLVAVVSLQSVIKI